MLPLVKQISKKVTFVCINLIKNWLEISHSTFKINKNIKKIIVVAVFI